jgi:threonine aldolase
MTEFRVDLFSDTKTRPSKAMLDAIVGASVGDEQTGEDPTTIALEERVAELLGKEAGLFMPSGTMCNETALAVHCRPGDEVIADETSHIGGFESGGPAVIAGVMVRAVPGVRGVFTAGQVEAAVRLPMRHTPRSRLVAVEQTANLGGGTVWPLENLRSVAQMARGLGLGVHMDGARLMNAAVAAGVPAREYAATADSAWIDLSKGLGCPVGAVLTGPRDFIVEAWRWKQRLGGAMRQSGVLAAAGLYALEHNVERLAEDHANAKMFAELVAELPGVALDPANVHTNIVVFDVTAAKLTAPQIAERLAARSIRIGALGAATMRAVTHLDVDEAGVRAAAEALAEILRG